MAKLYARVALVFLLFSVTIFAQKLNPGDGVRIFLYNTGDSISGDYYIQENGNVLLPYLGQIATANREFPKVKDEIEKKYTELYKDPEITVLPLYKVNILGEIKNPGFYYVTGIEKLSDLIAKAGGVTTDADLSDIHISRDSADITIDGEDIIKNGDKAHDISLKSGDQIYVAREWWVSARNSAFIISGIAVLITVATFFKK